MNTTLTLVDLGGAIALLIWGVHMVQTGITRAFGPQLRRLLSYALGNRVKAFLAGVGVTSILQSSTATGLILTAFAAGGGWGANRSSIARRTAPVRQGRHWVKSRQMASWKIAVGSFARRYQTVAHCAENAARRQLTQVWPGLPQPHQRSDRLIDMDRDLPQSSAPLGGVACPSAEDASDNA
jgi:hypothetical protein